MASVASVATTAAAQTVIVLHILSPLWPLQPLTVTFSMDSPTCPQLKKLRMALSEVAKIVGYAPVMAPGEKPSFDERIDAVVGMVGAMAEEIKVLKATNGGGGGGAAAPSPAAPGPTHQLHTDEKYTRARMEAAIEVAGKIEKLDSVFPIEFGLERGNTFLSDDTGATMVILGYDSSKPTYGCKTIPLNVLKSDCDILPVNIKNYSIEFVIKQVNPLAFERLRRSRITKHAHKYDIDPSYVSNGFNVRINSQTLRAVLVDIVPAKRKYPIKIQLVESGRALNYPKKLFHEKTSKITTAITAAVGEKRKLE